MLFVPHLEILGYNWPVGRMILPGQVHTGALTSIIHSCEKSLNDHGPIDRR